MGAKYLKYLQTKKSVVRITILAFLNSLFSITPILVMEKIVDDATTMDSSKVSSILMWAGIYLIMQVIGSALNAKCIFFSKKVSKNIGAQLQRRIYEKLTNTNITCIDQKGSLDVSNIVLEDTSNLSENYLEPIAAMMISIFSFIMALIYMLYMNWLLTLIVFPLGLITSIVSIRLQNKMDVAISEKRENSAVLWKVFNEIVFGIKSIRNFGEEAFFGRKLENASRNKKESDIEQARLETLAEAVLSALFMATIGGILLASSIFLVKGKITFGVMVAILMYNHMLVDPLIQLVDIQAKITKVKESIKRIDRILDLPEYSVNRQIEHSVSKIALEKVLFHYPMSSTRMEFTVTFLKNEKILVYGPSGIGKSTLAKLIMGLYAPEDGQVTFFVQGKKVPHYPYIGYMEQDGYLFDTSIRENILFSSEVKADEERYAKVLEVCCLVELVNEYGDKSIGINGNKLSGGQGKRVLLARTIYRDFPIYIFDEITSSLDSELVDNILNNLDTYLMNKIVIYIDHNHKVDEHVNLTVNIKEILSVSENLNYE